MLELNVNGRSVSLTVPADTPLIFVLRNDLGLKSVRFGCGLEQCGACKVIVDGVAVFSCVRAASEFAGKRITTVEGLGTVHGQGAPPAEHATGGALSPLQQAVLRHNAAQCGYCLSGVLMAATALLARAPQPSDGDIRAALADNLCRCGAHPRVLRAIREVADQQARAGGDPA